ncbi:hypothetical protein PMI28_00438 [Pseudomonas sp. GM48]|jgi:putative transcriptional regulator|nr:hypothetical protein PMI28_00438 [Pseudomonas sp. GM48]
MSKKFRSEVFESIHESASALYAIGAISKATMREFDESCLATVPVAIEVAEHRAETRSGNTGLRNRAEP